MLGFIKRCGQDSRDNDVLEKLEKLQTSGYSTYGKLKVLVTRNLPGTIEELIARIKASLSFKSTRTKNFLNNNRNFLLQASFAEMK